MKKLKLFFACLLMAVLSIGQMWATDVADKLTASDFTATSTTYTDFSNVSKTSDAVYAGNSAKDASGNIQLRSKNSAGIVSTTSGGTVKSVKITVASGTNTIDVYGSNTAYTGPADLYGSSKGTKVGSLTATGTVTFSDDYAYVGIRSSSGALYLSEVEITWTTGGSSDPTLSLAPSSLNLEAEGNSMQEITLSTTNFASPVNDVTCAFFSTATCDPGDAISQPAWITNLSDNNTNRVSFDVEDNDGAARSVWMKVTASDGTGSASAILAISQKALVVDYATLPFSFTGGRDDIATTSGMTQSGLGSDYTGSGVTTKLKFDGANDNVIIHFNAAPGTLSFDIKGNSFSGGTFKVQESADGDTYTDIYTYSADGTGVEVALSATARYVKFIYVTKSSGNIGLGNIAISEYVAPAAVATPVISGNDPFVTSTTVSITCETAGATIYYTTDGTDPKEVGEEYTGSFVVSGATTTVRAIANLGSDWSDFAINTFDKLTALTTMDEIFAAATDAGTTAKDVAITFNNWVVSGVSTNSKTAFLTDGTKGLMIYDGGASMGFAAGNVLSGTAICKVELKNGSAQLTALSSATTGLSVATGGTASLNVLDDAGIAALTGANTGSLIKISGECTSASTKYYVAGVQLYNTLFAFTNPTAGTNYECTGVFQLYNTTNEILPRSASDIVALTSVATPTFSVDGGTYTSVQSVELGCTTDGATIYYTTNGDTPDNTSTEYAGAITVDESMTIKAIAYKGEDHSEVATAAYTINLPPDPETTHTWDLSIDETATASDEELTWTATYVGMSIVKGSGTKVTNYYPGTEGKSYTSTRFYNGNTLTITPSGKQITSIVFTATGEGYATALAGSTWTNGVAAASGSTVTVTVSAPGAVSAAITGTCGLTAVKVNYGPIDPSIPATPTFSVDGGTYTSVQSVELGCTTDGATIYYTTNGDTPDNTSTEYAGAITVDESMTIKAIAIKDSKSSAVASAAYIINLPEILTTIQAVYDKAVAVGGTETAVTITFNNWVVSGISTDNKNVYVTDGTKGFVIYDSEANSGFAVNDKLSGTVETSLKLYKNYADVIGLKADATGLTVTNDGVVTPIVAAIADLGAVNTGAPIILNSVQFNGSVLSDGTNSITPYTTFYADAVTSLESGKYYNITGIYVHFNTTKEIAPRSAADIVESSLLDPEISYSPATLTIEVGDDWSAPTFNNPHSVTIASYASNNPTVASVSDGGVISLGSGTGTAIITASFAGDATYAAANATYTITVNPAGSSSNVVILAQYDGQWYAMKNTGITNNTAEAIAVTYSEDKIWDLPVADQANITWKRTVDGEGNVTFQAPNNDYLKTSSNNLAMSSGASGNYQWTWNSTYYRTGEQTRTFMYREAADGFKSYSAGNAGKEDYSDLPVVTAAVFDVTPTPGTEVRTGLTAGNYYTICYPKTMNTVTGATLWSFVGKEEGLAYIQQESAPFAAGKPYLMYATAATVQAVLEGDAVTTAGSNGALHGTFENLVQEQLDGFGSDVYLVIGNELRRATGAGTGSNTLPANRAYVKLSDIPEGAPAHAPGKNIRTMPMHKDATTAIDNAEASDAPRKVMIDGALFIIRGEKAYDATGRLVK